MVMCRKKPDDDIEARQYTGKNSEELMQWIGRASLTPTGDSDRELFLDTPEETVEVQPGDWILKCVDGFRACDGESFARRYEIVPEEAPKG